MGASIEAEQRFPYTSGAPHTAAVLESLAALEPTALAQMHGSAHRGPGDVWLRELAEYHRAAVAA